MKHVLISGLTLNDAVLLSSPSSSSLVLSCGSHCDNDRVVAETDGGSALIVPSDCLPTAPPRAVTLLDVCLELVCIVSCLFNPLHCHFRLRLWGPVAQLHAPPPPPPPCSCAVYTTPRRRHPRVGVCGCFPLTVCGLLCFISFMYLYTLYTVPMFCIKTVERADQIGVGFLRRTNKEYERVSKTFCGSCYWYQKIFNHMTEHYEILKCWKFTHMQNCGYCGSLWFTGLLVWVWVWNVSFFVKTFIVF